MALSKRLNLTITQNKDFVLGQSYLILRGLTNTKSLLTVCCYRVSLYKFIYVDNGLVL